MQPLTYTYEELIAHKESGNVPKSVIEKLKGDADEILTKPTLKVTDIKLPRPSGNIHDYTSISPYRWPNPDTPDGLPWVRRDGYVNPDTRTGIHPSSTCGRIHTLALAAFYFPEKAKEYAEYANRQMYDWFINPETKINPNAKYAQSIPGVCDGCSPGLIEFFHMHPFFNGVGVLDSLGLVDTKLLDGVKNWFVSFVNWLRTDDEIGIAEGAGRDNHGVWHDAFTLGAAVFTERKSLIRNILRSAYLVQIKRKINREGALPEELKRATSMHYSIYAYTPMLIIANIGERNGFSEYWGIDEDRGECILKKSADFMYPYVKNPKSWPYPELHPDTAGASFARCLASVAKRFPNLDYEEKINSLMKEPGAWMLEPVM